MRSEGDDPKKMGNQQLVSATRQRCGISVGFGQGGFKRVVPKVMSNNVL